MKKGYTLIEIVVAISIFVIILAAPTGFLATALKGQLRALASQKLLDNTSYALEYMSRALRMARKELVCLDIANPLTCFCLKTKGYGFNYENPAGKISALRFINYKNQCQEFFLEGGRLKERRAGITNYLTSDDLEIISLKFQLVGESQADQIQPMVTIFLELKNRTLRPELQPKIRIQTSISQRKLDISY